MLFTICNDVFISYIITDITDFIALTVKNNAVTDWQQHREKSLGAEIKSNSVKLHLRYFMNGVFVEVEKCVRQAIVCRRS